MNKKFIAWGKSKLLDLYIENKGADDILLIVDSNDFNEILFNRKLKDANIVIFAISNQAIQEILKTLNDMGYTLGENVWLYSDILLGEFLEKVNNELLMSFSIEEDYYLIKMLHLISNIPIHTTIFGNILFSLLASRNTLCNVAEVGGFCGGNMIANKLLFNNSEKSTWNNYYLIDSFEGFPVTSAFDKGMKRGDYKSDYQKRYIESLFGDYGEIRVIDGFVPDVFNKLKSREYGLVFYDCDLYQPALDTFEYFWPRLMKDGFLMVHDYYTLPGVRKATDEFFSAYSREGFNFYNFWESTSCVIKKIN